MQNVEIMDVLLNQLNFFGAPLNSTEIEAINNLSVKARKLTQFNFDKSTGIPKKFNLFQTHHCIVFLYHLSRLLFEDNQHLELCEKIYLLNRMLNGVDLFYKINMPDHFIVGHGLGTVFSKSKYGDYLVVFQNVTIGNQDGQYPIIGEKVVIYPNSVIAGNSNIGANSVIGAGTILINKSIPENSVVFQQNGILTIKNNDKNEIQKYFDIFV